MSRRLPPRSRLSRPRWAVSIAIGLGLIGFVGAAQWNSSLARQAFVTSAQAVLITEAEQLQRQQAALRDELAAAEERVRSLEEQDAGSQAVVQELSEELAAARLATGLQTVQGSGVVIEIADSLDQQPVGGNQPNYVNVDDLRAIVTALWASGAEAVAISGGAIEGGPPAERVVATSSIDGAGPAILVNSARLTPPYRIEAIGPDGLHDRFLSNPNFLTRVKQRIDTYGLQFASEPRAGLVIAEFIGNTGLRWGTPLEEGD